MLKFGLKSTFKSLVNVKAWVGWRSLSTNGRYVASLYSKLLTAPTVSPVKETFEEAQKKYGYTEEFLAQQLQQFRFAARLYLVVFCGGLLYLAWLCFYKYYMGAIVMVPMNFMLFSFYFRESFWAMQIERRRLGMSAIDWFKFVVLKNG